MKKIFILMLILLASAFSNVSAQVTPAGAGDKNLQDTNVKGRSNELERIDRDAKKEASKSKDKSAVNPAVSTAPEDKLAAKYGDIKTDYEQIQMSQDLIIKAYQGSGAIDYSQISKLSQEINKSAVRLNLNLFPAPRVETPDAGKVENAAAKDAEKTGKEVKKPQSVRELIVNLDNSIGSFATSTMFQNLRVVDPTVSEKTKTDLEKIIELSAMLDAESQKMATGGK